MNAKHTPGKLTDKEAARELFTAGYLQALDDANEAMRSIGVSAARADSIRALLTAKAAMVKARAAIAKAIGEQA